MRVKRAATSDAAVGRRIAEGRRSRGLSQAELATRASLDRTALSKIETGRRKVASTELGRVAAALDLPFEHFFSGRPEGAGRDALASIRSKRRAILSICQRHGAHSPRLFGSVARGDATSESDIDFIVEIEDGRSLFDLAALLLELRDLLGRDVDVVTAEGLRDRIRERVMDEAVPL